MSLPVFSISDPVRDFPATQPADPEISLNILPDVEASFFLAEGRRLHLGKGANLLRQGAMPRGVHLLLEGRVKLYRQLLPAQRQIFHFYTAGDLIGYCQVLSDTNATFYAEVLDNCTTLFVTAERFRKYARQSASLANFLLDRLSREYLAWSDNSALLARRSVRERLAVCLITLHDLFRIPPNPTTVISLSRTDLADYAATTLETTARVLREMKDAGLLHIRGRRIVILDMPALLQLAYAGNRIRT
jgi:CRP-like cAMP-binding protein